MRHHSSGYNTTHGESWRMTTVEFKLPDLGEGIHEAEIVSIKVKEGDQVKEDDTLFEVETDKAMVEIPSPYSGTVSRIFVSEGETVKVGMTLIAFNLSGEVKKPAAGSEKKQAGAKAAAEVGGKSTGKTEKAVMEVERVEAHGPGHALRTGGNGKPQHDPGKPVPAAPAVRRLARELGVDLYSVAGSGSGGRVLKEDVRAYAAGTLENRISGAKGNSSTTTAEQPLSLHDKYGGKGEGGTKLDTTPLTAQAVELPDFERFGKIERVPLRSIRRKIAQNMALSWSHIPHVTQFDEADVTELARLIAKNEEKSKSQPGPRITLSVFTIKAVVSALKKYLQFNSSLDEGTGEIIFKHYFNLGIAVATERGLIVPVIRNADQKSLVEIANELKEIAEKTRAGKIELDRLQGST